MTQPDPVALRDRRKAFAEEAAARLKALEADFKTDPTSPLVTPYTRFLGVTDDRLRDLYKIRRGEYGDDIPMPPMPKLREVIEDLGVPLRLRKYQREMICHLAYMPRFVNGDGVGLGKTLVSIAGACAVDDMVRAALGKGVKVIVLTTSTTSYQWETEVKRFSHLNPWVLKDAYTFKGDKKATYGHTARIAQLKKFMDHPKLDVLICRYSQWTGKRALAKLNNANPDAPLLDHEGRPLTHDGKEKLSDIARDFRDALTGYKDQLVLILDETHKVKTPDALIRNVIMAAQRKCGHVWGLTATAIKNHLEEFYAIFSAIGVSPLGSLPHFRENYCKWECQRFGPRVEYKIVGYFNIPQFKVGMRPWYWGRSQAQVGEPLPKLTTLYHPVELSAAEAKLLLEDIPSGNYVLPPTLRKVAGEIELVERDPSNLMTALGAMQAVANSSALLDVSDLKTFHSPKLSSKEAMLLDMLDGEFAGEKVLIFTKYRTWIDRLEHLTNNRKFTERNFLRITGGEKGKLREANRLKFQDPNSAYNMICINSAAIEGVNLQQAAHLIALDLPWSWGDLIQLVGRMVRMASPHSACTFHILYALGTIDEYVIETQKGKKGVFERILGSAGTVGLLEEGNTDLGNDLENAFVGLEDESDDNFKDLLRAHAKKIGLGAYVFGDMLAKEQAGMREGKRGGGVKMPGAVTEVDLDAHW
jgi:SNF2 family DNA or RNA helicase